MINNETSPRIQIPEHGFYRGVRYSVMVIGDKRSIDLGLSDWLYRRKGYDMSLLKNIGDQDPETVIDAFIASMPEQRPGRLRRATDRISGLLTNHRRPAQPI